MRAPWGTANRFARGPRSQPFRSVAGLHALGPLIKAQSLGRLGGRSEALVPLREAKAVPWWSARRVQGGTIPPLLGGWDTPPTEIEGKKFSDPS
jgi:hypothetical protein